MKLYITILLLIMIGSCGKEKTIRKFKSEAMPEAYSYFFSEDDCDTGEQIFYRLEDACRGVLDNELNNFCALEERLELYSSSCEGLFTERT